MRTIRRGALAPRLRILREQAGLSQDDLARLAGVGVATVLRVESGKRANWETLDKLAGALQLERKDLTQPAESP